MKKFLRPLIVFFALATVIGFVATRDGGSDDGIAVSPDVGIEESGGGRSDVAVGAPAATADGAKAPGTTGAVLGDVAAVGGVGPSIIRYADLGVIVPSDGFDAAFDAASQLASRYGGFVVSSSVEGVDRRSGWVSLRIPSERFDAALADLRALGEVERQSVSGEDVSMTLVDLDARLRSWKAQEAVLLDLMAEARTVADTLKIQVELQNVQMNIESIQGQLRWLEEQVDLATISVYLREPGADGYEPDDGPQIGEAWDRAVEAFLTVIVAMVVGVGYLTPIAILGWAALAVLRWFRRRRAGGTGGAAAA